MKQYNLVNNVLGWLTFFVAAFVYCSTIEPTASFWDCPEFITTGYKLEVGHPPGAPFFMLTANLFSQFASDPTQVARMVNTMSALLSATTILFLFWSITHLARKLILKDWSEMTMGKMIAIQASGLVGALIYTFSDTFWFSAVEGEVYAYSSAFTAIVFWLILKWEDHADEPHSDRWLVLISYMTGLSIGVHLLNLLCIPAIVLVYCYRRYPNIELKGSLLALIGSFVIVAGVLYGVVPGIITVAGWFELLFVNKFGCPFNTGEIIYIILVVAIVIWAIYESYVDRNFKRQNISFTLAVGMLVIPFRGTEWGAAIMG
uniref:glycosyltransferase family 117 protein n=1 Tax=Leyella stercorea TaxID=363265 RepID=UPI003FEF77DA